MKPEKFEEIEEHVNAINDYLDEIEYVESFFEKKKMNINDTNVMFWNHLITLFERIDEDDQNNLDLEDVEKPSDEAQLLTKEFEAHLNNYRPFELTKFEKYLMQIHFEQIL